MKATNIPGFTAETSLDWIGQSHQLSAKRDRHVATGMIRPQLGISCTGKNGDECYCPTGCKKKSGGSCCCTVDRNCFFNSTVFGGGGVFEPF